MKITIAYQCGEPVADVLNALAPFFKADSHTASEVAEGRCFGRAIDQELRLICASTYGATGLL